MSEELNGAAAASIETQAPVVTTATAEPITESFINTLPEDLRAESSLQDIKDVAALAKGYVNAQRMIGGSVRIPSEDASVEAKNEFYKKLQSVPGVVRLPVDGDKESLDAFYNRIGRPESHDKYKLALDEADNVDHSQVGQFKQLAYQIGLTNEQANKLAEFEMQRIQQQSKMFDEVRNTAEATLRQTWGHDFDNRLQGAKEVISMYSSKYPEAVQELVNGPAGNNPALLAMLSELYSSMKETGAVSAQSNVKYGLAPEEAADKISDIMQNKAHPYHNQADPGHRDAVEKMRKLYSAAYPS